MWWGYGEGYDTMWCNAMWHIVMQYDILICYIMSCDMILWCKVMLWSMTNNMEHIAVHYSKFHTRKLSKLKHTHTHTLTHHTQPSLLLTCLWPGLHSDQSCRWSSWYVTGGSLPISTVVEEDRIRVPLILVVWLGSVPGVKEGEGEGVNEGVREG